MDFLSPPARRCNKILHKPTSVAFQNIFITYGMLLPDQNIYSTLSFDLNKAH